MLVALWPVFHSSCWACADNLGAGGRDQMSKARTPLPLAGQMLNRRWTLPADRDLLQPGLAEWCAGLSTRRLVREACCPGPRRGDRNPSASPCRSCMYIVVTMARSMGSQCHPSQARLHRRKAHLCACMSAECCGSCHRHGSTQAQRSNRWLNACRTVEMDCCACHPLPPCMAVMPGLGW